MQINIADIDTFIKRKKMIRKQFGLINYIFLGTWFPDWFVQQAYLYKVGFNYLLCICIWVYTIEIGNLGLPSKAVRQPEKLLL